MKCKTILFTVLLMLAAMGLGGCSTTNPAVSQTVSDLPFSVPEVFSYDASATEKNGMLTFTGENGATLIVSCTESSESFFEESRSQPLTAAALTEAYQAAGLEVTVAELERQETDDALLYTFAVYYTDGDTTTVTRKYIRITAEQVLDLSCGGDVTDADGIDEDYGAVLAALQ